jgi:hypothetical protein
VITCLSQKCGHRPKGLSSTAYVELCSHREPLHNFCLNQNFGYLQIEWTDRFFGWRFQPHASFMGFVMKKLSTEAILWNLGGVGHCYAWQGWVLYFIPFIYTHILGTLLYFSTNYCTIMTLGSQGVMHDGREWYQVKFTVKIFVWF